MKMKLAVIASICINSTGCVSTPPPPKGDWLWVSPTQEQKVSRGELSSAEAKHEFVVDSNTCKIEGLKVPLPSPSCTQLPKQDCSNLTGYQLGYCLTYTPQPRCDYSSLNAAQNAQKEIFNSCMAIKGWELKWFPEEPSAQPSQLP